MSLRLVLLGVVRVLVARVQLRCDSAHRPLLRVEMVLPRCSLDLTLLVLALLVKMVVGQRQTAVKVLRHP